MLNSNNKLIRSAFVRMMIVNMFVMIATNICGFVDNIVIGRILGTDALAAVGYFSPVATAVSLFNVIVLGVQVLCGNYIGAGKKEQINSLFVSAFVFLFIMFTGIAIATIICRDGLSALLGAKGAVHEMLCGYIAGYMPGVPAQALCAMLMALVSFNNDIRRSYLSAAVMAAGNTAGDLLLAGMGTFGIGLASTFSYIIALAILLPGFRNKDRALHFELIRPGWEHVWKAFLRGVPSMMFTAGLLVKNTLMNYTLSTWGGSDGVAVVNVLYSVCGLLGIVSGGFGAAFVSLAGLYYGEEDRDSFTGLFRIALYIGETCFIGIVVLLMLFSPVLPGLFFDKGTQEWEMCRQMFLLGFLFYPINIFLSCMLNSYNAQSRMRIVNVMSAVETSMIGVGAFLTVSRFGTSAAWFANTWVDILCVIIVLGYAWIIKGKVSFRIPYILSLSDSFGASPEEFREYSVKTMKDITFASESIISFCKEKKTGRQSLYAGICVEEMAKNIIQHGSAPGKEPCVDIRVVARDELTIRIRDNCPEFDPRKRLELYDSQQSPEMNFGIRLTAKLAKQIDYYNNAGINTLIMKL